MTKGKYVATVTFDFHIRYDVIFIDSFKNKLNESVKELLEEYAGDDATVTVVQQMCDMYKETED